MFYTVYRTTNQFNGKFYVGKHQTKDLNDGYVGSGKWLVRAIKKHGIENFVTEIIAIYDVEWKMNLAERILAVVDIDVSYNLCSGGKGGFSFINGKGLTRKFTKEDLLKGVRTRQSREYVYTELQIAQRKKKASDALKVYNKSEKGKAVNAAKSKTTHLNLNSPEAIAKRQNTFKERGHSQGSKNSQFGKKRTKESKQKTSQKLKQNWVHKNEEEKAKQLAALKFARSQRKYSKT